MLKKNGPSRDDMLQTMLEILGEFPTEPAINEKKWSDI